MAEHPTSLRPSMRPFGPCQHTDRDKRRTRFPQGFRGLAAGCARGENVINEQHACTGQIRMLLDSKGATDVIPTAAWWQVKLFSSRSAADKQKVGERPVKRRGNPFAQDCGTVVTSKESPRPVHGNRHHDMRLQLAQPFELPLS